MRAQSVRNRLSRTTVTLMRTILFLLSVAFLLLLSRSASAQDSDSPAGEVLVDTMAAAQVQREPVQKKSPERALAYSLGGTAGPAFLGPSLATTSTAGWREGVGWGLLIGGIFVGPSLGHFYAENNGQAWGGILIRGGSAALGLWGNWIRIFEDSGRGKALVATGALGFAGSLLYDIATAYSAAQDYNQAHGPKARVMPKVGPQGRQAGLSLQVQF